MSHIPSSPPPLLIREWSSSFHTREYRGFSIVKSTQRCAVLTLLCIRPIDTVSLLSSPAACSGTQLWRRWLSLPWQCTSPGPLPYLLLMPVQAPGVRPPDFLHRNSMTVQGIESCRVYAIYPYNKRICIAACRCASTSARVL